MLSMFLFVTIVLKLLLSLLNIQTQSVWKDGKVEGLIFESSLHLKRIYDRSGIHYCVYRLLYKSNHVERNDFPYAKRKTGILAWGDSETPLWMSHLHDAMVGNNYLPGWALRKYARVFRTNHSTGVVYSFYCIGHQYYFLNHQ